MIDFEDKAIHTVNKLLFGYSRMKLFLGGLLMISLGYWLLCTSSSLSLPLCMTLLLTVAYHLHNYSLLTMLLGVANTASNQDFLGLKSWQSIDIGLLFPDNCIESFVEKDMCEDLWLWC